MECDLECVVGWILVYHWLRHWIRDKLLCAGTAATSKKWIEAKMKELGVTSNVNYRLCMMLDDLAMITVDTPTYGVIQANIACLLSEYSPSIKAYLCLTAVAICYLNCCFSFFLPAWLQKATPKVHLRKTFQIARLEFLQARCDVLLVI